MKSIKWIDGQHLLIVYRLQTFNINPKSNINPVVISNCLMNIFGQYTVWVPLSLKSNLSQNVGSNLLSNKDTSMQHVDVHLQYKIR